MRIPENTEIHQGELATYWFDESGILWAIIKPLAPTLEKVKANYELIRRISNHQKVRLLSDSSSSKILDDETGAFIAIEMPRVFKAIAVISATTMGKVNTVIFKNLYNETVPISIFSEETEAKAWLIEQMNS